MFVLLMSSFDLSSFSNKVKSRDSSSSDLGIFYSKCGRMNNNKYGLFDFISGLEDFEGVLVRRKRRRGK